MDLTEKVDHKSHRYPYCLVWSPLPIISWIFPLIGHLAIASSQGIIHEFYAPYTVRQDKMGFGWPIRYIQLDIGKVSEGDAGWDAAIDAATIAYSKKIHKCILDNCYTYCSMALNVMNYDSRKDWNMLKLSVWMLFWGKYVGFMGIVKTWLPVVAAWTCVLGLFVYFLNYEF